MARKGTRRRRSDLPARSRRTGNHGGINAQQQHRGSRHFRCEREAAAGGQIKPGHPAPAFENHSGQTTAAQRIAGGTHQVERIARQAEETTTRRTAQCCPAIPLYNPHRTARMA